jgi:hypothetical protein
MQIKKSGYEMNGFNMGVNGVATDVTLEEFFGSIHLRVEIDIT